jgi:hypothetical protein
MKSLSPTVVSFNRLFATVLLLSVTIDVLPTAPNASNASSGVFPIYETLGSD